LLKSREAEVLRFIIKVALMGTLLMATITPPVITHAGGAGGMGGGAGGMGGGAGGSGSAGGVGGGGYAVGYPFAGTHGWSYQNRFDTRVFRIRRNHNPGFGGGSFGSSAFVRFDRRAPQPGWHVRRHATHLRDVQRSHNDQRIKASLKPHEALRKTLQKPDPAAVVD
jgi:hypothetical protein